VINKVNKSPAFSSRIEFINRGQYSQIRDLFRENPKAANIMMNEISPICESGETGSLTTCTGGEVINKDELMLFHFSRDVHVEKNKKDIRKNLEYLQNKESLYGLITGGEFYDISLNCLKNLLKIFNPAKIKSSVLWGHEFCGSSSTVAAYSKNKDTWHLCTTKNMWRDSADIKTPEDLKKFYRHIYISKDDTLVLDGKEISRKEVNTIKNPLYHPIM